MDKIDVLIRQGQSHDFGTNSHNKSHGTFSKATADLLGWVATVEDFIRNNYGEESSAFKLFMTFNREKLNGYLKEDFDNEITTLIGALKACKNIPLKISEKKDEHLIIQLIKNLYFWSVLVLMTSAAFGLGMNFGSNKFDKEKIELSEENSMLKDSIQNLQAKKEAMKYLLEFSFRTSQIEIFINQVDTFKKDKWIPALYIWRVVSGDKAYEPSIKEFKNVAMLELANWLKINLANNKNTNIDKVISSLSSFPNFEDGRNPTYNQNVKKSISVFKEFLKQEKINTNN